MDYILSENNKGFLWNILYEKNIFNGIPNDNLDKVKHIFESTIVNVSQNSKNKEIIEINKEILRILNTEIQNLKHNLLESKNIKDEFKDEKKVIFNKNLENHKNSLNQLMNVDKPNEIDFADKNDDPIDNNELNRILEEMQRERNIETNIIENQISDKKIINTHNIMSEIENNKVPKLKIESIEELLETEVVNLNKISDKRIDKISDKRIDKISDKRIDDFKKEDIKLKSINKLLDNEYKEENKLNTNVKLENIIKLLNKLATNQEKIMNKLQLI